MTGWLVYDAPEAKRNAWIIERYRRSAAARGVELTLELLERMECEMPERLPDFCICRRPAPAFRSALEDRGVPVFNSSFADRLCNDKHKTAEFAKALGIPVAEEYAWGRAEELKTPPFPAVVKPVDGHGGQGVFLVRGETEWEAAVRALSGRTVVVQRPVQTLGRDLRVYLLGKRPVAAMLRISDRDFRSNFSLGGRAEPRELMPEMRAIVSKIAEAADFGLVGVDLIFDGETPVLNEIEDVVGARMLYAGTDIDIADEYVAYILKTIQ